MRILEKIWSDITKGENIDLYATIAVSFVIVVLNSLIKVSPSTVTSLTLAVLGLLAISNIVNRWRIKNYFDSQLGTLPFMEEFPPSLKVKIDNAAELYLVGVTLTQTVRQQSHIIEGLLHRGCIINVLLVHPTDSLIDIAKYRIREPKPDITSDVYQTLKVCCSLKESAPGNLNIRTIRYPLGCCIKAVNPNSSSGIIYIANYSFRTSHPHVPKYSLQPKDGIWYEYLKEELFSLWDAGVEWDCDAT